MIRLIFILLVLIPIELLHVYCQQFESGSNASNIKILDNIRVQTGKLKRFKDGVFEEEWVQINSTSNKKNVIYLIADRTDTLYWLKKNNIMMMVFYNPIRSSNGGKRVDKRYVLLNINTFKVLLDYSLIIHEDAGWGDTRMCENRDVEFNFDTSNYTLDVKVKFTDCVKNISAERSVTLKPNNKIGGAYFNEVLNKQKLYIISPTFKNNKLIKKNGNWVNVPKLISNNASLYCCRLPFDIFGGTYFYKSTVSPYDEESGTYYYNGKIYRRLKQYYKKKFKTTLCLCRDEDYRFI